MSIFDLANLSAKKLKERIGHVAKAVIEVKMQKSYTISSIIMNQIGDHTQQTMYHNSSNKCL